MADSQRKSYNLFDEQYGTITTTIQYIPINIGEGTFTLSTTTPISGNSACLFFLAGNVSSGASGDNNVYVGQNRTVTSINGYVTIGYRTTNSIYPSSYKTMLNTGSTALPYEPYGWVHSLRKLGTATETIQSGDTIYANGQPITTYTLKGNTVQNGTPTPSNPVDVNGMGNKTANFFDYKTAYSNYIVSNGDVVATNVITAIVQNSLADFIGQQITISVYGKQIESSFLRLTAVINGTTVYGNIVYANTSDYMKLTVTPETANDYWRIAYGTAGTNTLNQFMINEGTERVTYEPYGYKIPISTLQGSAVNYLGSVQSTRQIRKLVLDGTETYYKDSGGESMYYIYINPVHAKKQNLYCTHLPSVTDYPRNSIGMYAPISVNSLIYFNVGIDIMNAQPSGNTVAGLKEYLAAQYANGTPVTVWYIRETPTTGIVNEPLMKISDYSDSISNAAAIPTTEGANTITVDTTVQPSEFTATWTGWHDASVKEKSENLFDASTSVRGYYINASGEEVQNSSTEYEFAHTQKIPVQPNTEYTYSLVVTQTGVFRRIIAYDSSKNFLSQISDLLIGLVGYKSYSFTTPANCYYITINYIDDRYNNDDKNLMLNVGSEPLPYASYWE